MTTEEFKTLREGDKVTINDKFRHLYLPENWPSAGPADCYWVDSMDGFIGKDCVISSINLEDSRVLVTCKELGTRFHFYHLSIDIIKILQSENSKYIQELIKYLNKLNNEIK